ncbi:MAG: hypothetical protein A2Y40_05145 [Candidatus Margulisbacteria bacterium GWF2_35_9]|nr:MAG: hypothetical protein A2Y40_05145 [Candidatus Margulisbacteria bacterium GWF2_35_9]
MANILIIDHCQFVRDQLTKYFYQKQQTVFTASSGQEAIDQIRKIIPDVILIDINLPNVSGSLVIQEIRNILPTVKIIGISSTTDKEKVTWAIKSGISVFKLKPFRIDTLVNETLKL